jgi:hypothetical protein
MNKVLVVVMIRSLSNKDQDVYNSSHIYSCRGEPTYVVVLNSRLKLPQYFIDDPKSSAQPLGF